MATQQNTGTLLVGGPETVDHQFLSSTNVEKQLALVVDVTRFDSP
jgi:hypothetical protein